MGLRIVSLNDLEGLSEYGDKYRSCCPVHGGGNRTALVIDKMGRYKGFGYCFVCGRNVVWVKDITQEESSQDGERGFPQKVLVPPERDSSAPSLKVAKSWQVAEHQLLCSLHERMSYALELSPRAQHYLESRGVSLWVAQQIGMLYLSRRVLVDPVYAPHARLLYRWVDSIIFPLYRRVFNNEEVEGQERYVQGYIGRTLKMWEPNMDEDQHKLVLDGHNRAVRDANSTLQQGQKSGREILRWVKTEPAGWFYPGAPHRVGPIAVLVEGGWDSCGVLSGLSHQLSLHMGEQLPPAGGFIGLAGTAADPGLLPSSVKAVVLALDDDEAGRKRMRLLRESHLKDGRPTYMFASASPFGKDWSARWRLGGVQTIQPLLLAYRYVQTWLLTPPSPVACLLLVDELADALALLSASKQGCMGTRPLLPEQIVVLTSRSSFSHDWFSPSAQPIIFASGILSASGSTQDRRDQLDDPVTRANLAMRERLRRLREDITTLGASCSTCTPPSDGMGETWSARWEAFGQEGLRPLIEAYHYASEQHLFLRSA